MQRQPNYLQPLLDDSTVALPNRHAPQTHCQRAPRGRLNGERPERRADWGGVQVLVGLGAACSNGADPGALRTSVQRQVVIGLFRDLRGITMATNSRRNYGVLLCQCIHTCDCAAEVVVPCPHCMYAPHHPWCTDACQLLKPTDEQRHESSGSCIPITCEQSWNPFTVPACSDLPKSLQRLPQTPRLLPAGLLFDWLYPAHFPTLRVCLEAWADSPDATTAMLKFMAEFALNKTQRLTFDSSSPNGILLFREVSKVGSQGLCR